MPKVVISNRRKLLSSQWVFKDKELLSTPRQLELKGNFDLREEAYTRSKGCQMLERVGKSLEMSMDKICNAKILLHRFYMRKSTVKCPYQPVAAALLFMAGKLGDGEDFVRIEKLIYFIVKDSCREKAPGTFESLELQPGFSKLCLDWQSRIFDFENIILEKLCFDDHAILPHSFALDVIKKFEGSEKLSRAALQYCNDALRSSLAVRCSPKIIAYASVFAACGALGEEMSLKKSINSSFPAGSAWWFVQKQNFSRLKALALEISINRDCLSKEYDDLYTKVQINLLKRRAEENLPNTPITEGSPIFSPLSFASRNPTPPPVQGFW